LNNYVSISLARTEIIHHINATIKFTDLLVLGISVR
jgi:hypothetical protein